MTEAKIAGQFNIKFRDGGYYVDIPNYDGGDVVPADVARDMLEALRGAIVIIDSFAECPKAPKLAEAFIRRRLAVIAAIAKATGAS